MHPNKLPVVRDEFARNILVELNLPLVGFFLKHNPWILDALGRDAKAVCCLAFIRACELWDEGKGALATYACCCLDLAAREARKKEYKWQRQHKQMQYAYAYSAEEVVGEYWEGFDGVDNRDEYEFLQRKMDEFLSERQREVLFARNLEDRTGESLAEERGVSKQAVFQMESIAIKQLRKVIQNERLRRELAWRKRVSYEKCCSWFGTVELYRLPESEE